MLTQNTLTQARKLKLRWFVSLSTLPLLAVVSAFGIIPQHEIASTFKQNIIETVSLPDNKPSTGAMNIFWRVERVQRGDTISELLRRLNVHDEAATDYLRKNKTLESTHMLALGKEIQAETSPEGALLSLHYLDNNNQIRINKVSDGFGTSILSIPTEKRIIMRTGEINSSLFSATDSAGLSDIAANQLADIFSGDIDFHRDLRKGDTFSVIYEMNFSNGEPLSTGKILAAEFTNRGHQYRALYYEMSPNNGSYFSPEGKSMRKAFLRSPIEFSRISSGFKHSRFHPVLNKWRAHKGVDYAAAIGTKVKSTADGTIAFVGKQSGYGNVVIINHQGHYTTVYGHLSRFADGLHRGQRVSQGEVVAFVGKSGLATGPHLHYEFKINGQQHDPQRVALPDAKPISILQKLRFQAMTANINIRLSMLSGKQVAQLD